MQHTNGDQPEITVQELKARFIEEVKRTIEQLNTAQTLEVREAAQSVLIAFTIVGTKLGLVTDAELEKLFTDATPSGLILPDPQLAK
jgi:hypothetical protein